MKQKHTYTKKENGLNDTGRPTLYKPDYCQDIVAFFETAPKFQEVRDSHSEGFQSTTRYKNVPAQMPTLFRYARKIGVNQDTLHEWCRKHKEFSEAFNTAKEIQKEWLIEIGMSGLTPPASFIFVAKNITDMKDKSEQDLNLKTYEHFKKLKQDYGFGA